MTEPKIEVEVPLQVREFAKKGIGQAEKAISSFMMGWTPRRRHRCAKVEVLSTT